MTAVRLFVFAFLLSAPLHVLLAADPQKFSARESESRLRAEGNGWGLEKARIADASRPRVLLIGDSILGGYQKHVIAALDGKAYVDVWQNPHCQSEKTNQVLAEVLDEGPYDVVHANMGLHGWPEGRIKEGTFEPLTRAYIDVIRTKLPKAKIIWANSTPVRTKNKPGELDRVINANILEQNRMSAKVMVEMNVPVNDFYSLLENRLDLAKTDQFHWTPPAYEILGEAAARSISAALPADQAAARPPTICNPLDLPYRFELIPGKNGSSFRTAADPSAVYFDDQYWIFASKSGGYWHSADFLNWKLVKPTGYNVELFAPTVVATKDRLYLTTRNSGIFTTDDPAQGTWRLVSTGLKIGQDGAIFIDDDGRWYVYWGCSSTEPIRGLEVDPHDGFSPKGEPLDLLSGDPSRRGWETFTKVSDRDVAPGAVKWKPWIEGAWMNKVGGRYYLQYAAPGTQWDTYADGVFVSEHPLGPFTYQTYSPFSSKPTGFARGAGHGSTFTDARGNHWHIATTVISGRHPFERRISVYPARFFSDGQMACNTYLGDYPQYPPGVAADPFESNSPSWMLLSLKKPVTVSSELPSYPADRAVNEDLHDWWAATTGNAGEWLQVDLGAPCRIEAVQVNFADQDATHRGHLHDGYRFIIEFSVDGSEWQMLVDRAKNTLDSPHHYVQLVAPLTGRFLRLTSVHTPAGARFSVSGFRVFGIAPGTTPDIVSEITAERDAADGRHVRITWPASRRAEFYIVRYGLKPDRLYSSCQIYSQAEEQSHPSLDLSLLNSDTDYYFAVDAVNASGISRGTAVAAARAGKREATP